MWRWASANRLVPTSAARTTTGKLVAPSVGMLIGAEYSPAELIVPPSGVVTDHWRRSPGLAGVTLAVNWMERPVPRVSVAGESETLRGEADAKMSVLPHPDEDHSSSPRPIRLAR